MPRGIHSNVDSDSEYRLPATTRGDPAGGG